MQQLSWECISIHSLMICVCIAGMNIASATEPCLASLSAALLGLRSCEIECYLICVIH